MYTEHFGLKALPFENVPDPAFFFDAGDYHRVLLRMTDSLTAGRGLMAVAGPIGAGKTTLSQKLMADLPRSARLVWLAEPPSDAAGLLLFIARELGLESVPGERVFAMREIRARLLELDAEDSRCLVIVDESHLVSDDTLEGIRLLNNLEVGSRKLLQVILLGQQELVEQLARPELEPFRQRISAMEVIGAMDPVRLREYVLHRLRVAGASGTVFSETALDMIAASTGGIPRVTNSLCDRSLRVAWELGRPVVDAPEVHQAATDLGLGRQTLHYVLKLRSMKEGKDQEGVTDSRSRGRPGPSEKESAGEKASTALKHRDEGEEKEEESSLRGPLLLLALSLFSFAASIAFYCLRVGNISPGNCVEGLVRSLF